MSLFSLRPRWRLLFIQFLFLICSYVSGQGVLPGQITDESDQPLRGAWVSWPGSGIRTPTDEEGLFSVPLTDTSALYLVAGCPGFQTDTFEVKGVRFAYIQLTLLARSLAEVHVVRRRQGSFIDPGQAGKTEVITRTELTKAACCDMAGCFETQGSVQPQTTNVLTNARELRILGLSGVYNQVLMDGLPMIQGLTYTYGVSSIPASIIDKIFVAKGAGSVLQGFEGITGQINVVTREPAREPAIYANGYMNNFGERHLNGNYSARLDTAGKTRVLAGFHVVQPAGRRDRDADGFLDLPLLTRYSVFNRWNYGKENEAGFFSHFSWRLTRESRVGGQRNFNPETDKGGTKVYGQTTGYLQPEGILKAGFRFSEHHALQLQASAFGQAQQSWFGTLNYRASQENLNVVVQHQRQGRRGNQFTWGGSFRYQNLIENIAFSENLPPRSYAGRYSTGLRVPGLFAESKGSTSEGRFTWIAGMRLDHHNGSGLIFTPRTLLKWDLAEKHSLRASAGTGWRQVNLLPENITITASSRDLIRTGDPAPEKAFNWGGSYTWSPDLSHMAGTISVDFYQTRFQNQVFPDFTREPQKVFTENFRGTSVSNSLQAEANLKIWEFLDLRLCYNYLDVYRIEGDRKNELPFNPRNRLIAVLSYRPVSDRLYIDLNVHAYDRQRLPATRLTSGEPGPDFSRPYQIFNLQVTWKYHTWEFYAGMENVLDFRQRQPVAGWQNPFGPGFDTGTVWGPTRGRETYLGLRWSLPEKRKKSR